MSLVPIEPKSLPSVPAFAVILSLKSFIAAARSSAPDRCSRASFSSFRDVWGRRTTRYGLNALVMVVLILGVIALVEAVSYRHNWRVDLTENKRHSLSPQTGKVLKELRGRGLL